MRYDVICEAGHPSEIEKPMAAGYPTCPKCGRELRRLFDTVPAVHYAAAGFFTTDVSRFAGLVGPERAARFEAQRDDAERRARAGKLTPYEKVLETL